jgi:hypothetical protein
MLPGRGIFSPIREPPKSDEQHRPTGSVPPPSHASRPDVSIVTMSLAKRPAVPWGGNQQRARAAGLIIELNTPTEMGLLTPKGRKTLG